MRNGKKKTLLSAAVHQQFLLNATAYKQAVYNAGFIELFVKTKKNTYMTTTSQNLGGSTQSRSDMNTCLKVAAII